MNYYLERLIRQHMDMLSVRLLYPFEKAHTGFKASH
jgi:hypothetical protein